jgi:hypothetical protein
LFAFSTDMGLDEVLFYRFNATRGSLAANDPPFVKLPRGAGAMIPAFHPNGKFAYVIEEMDSIVSTLDGRRSRRRAEARRQAGRTGRKACPTMPAFVAKPFRAVAITCRRQKADVEPQPRGIRNSKCFDPPQW